MPRPAPLLPLFLREKRPVLFARGLLLAALLMSAGLGAGCSHDGNCQIGEQACFCRGDGTCGTGLTCVSGLCQQASTPVTTGAGGASGVSTAVDVPPVQPPDGGDSQWQIRDAGSLDLAPFDASGSDLPAGAPGAPTWTVLVYGHADHNLSNSFLRDFQEMSRARLTDNIRLIVLVDWNASDEIADTKDKFPTGAFFYRITGSGQKPQLIGVDDELDFDDPSVLAAAMAAVYKQFPSDHRGLILWDHGGAWVGGFGGDTQDGTRPGTPMTVATVAGAVRTGLTRAGLTGPRPLDFFSFDACLMAGTEVMSWFEDLAKIYISDAEVDFGDGWDYEATFSWLSQNPAASPAEFGAAEVSAWDAQHAKATANDVLFRSHAAFDMEKYGAFAHTVHPLVDAIRAGGKGSPTAHAIFASQPSYLSDESDSHGIDLIDVRTLLSGLSTTADPAVAAAAKAALEGANASRVAVSAGAFRQEQLGMHVYAGPPLDLPPTVYDLYPKFNQPWNAESSWGDLLTFLRDATNPVQPTLVGTLNVPDVPTQDNPPSVQFDVTGDDVNYVEADLYERNPADDGKTLILHGTIASQFVGPGSYKLSWPGKTTALLASPDNLTVTMAPWAFAAKAGTLQTPLFATKGVLDWGDGTVWDVSLLVDADTNQASLLMVSDASGSMSVFPLAEVVKESEGKAVFVPRIDTYDTTTDMDGSYVAKSGVYIPASGTISFTNAPVPAGVYALGVFAFDVWGHYALDVKALTLSQPVQ